MDDLDLDEEGGGRPGTPVDPGRMLHEMLRYWRVVPIAGAFALVVGVLVSSRFASATYSSSVALLWEDKANRQRLVTLVDSVKLNSNLVEVRKRLKLKTGIEKLRKRINVMFDRDSFLVVVGAEAGNADGASALATTVVDVFREHQKKVALAQREERLQVVEADLQIAQVSLSNARVALGAFKKQLDVVDFATERQIALQQALNMKEQAEMARRKADAEVKRGRKLAAEAKRAPKTRSGGQTFVNQDAVAMAQKKAELAQAAARLAPDHPAILSLKAQIATLKSRAKSKANVVGGGVNVTANMQYEELKQGVVQAEIDREMFLQQHKSFLELEQKARARLQDLEKAEGQATELASRVEMVGGQVLALQKQRLVARDAVRSVGSSFRIVTPATRPEKPDQTKGNKTAIKFSVVAVVLTVLGLLGYALRGLKVYTAREAGYWANAPVVASSTWPRDSAMLSTLVDELSDHAPVAYGSTLVVGARPNEVSIAREVAYWLGNVTGWPQKALIGDIQREDGSTGAKSDADEADSGPQQDASSEAGATALVRTAGQRDSQTVEVMSAQAWDGPTDGPVLRRAARLADRVLVVAASGSLSAIQLWQLKTRLGREEGVGLLLVGLDPAFVKLPDRVGGVDEFWSGETANG